MVKIHHVYAGHAALDEEARVMLLLLVADRLLFLVTKCHVLPRPAHLTA